MNIYLIYIDGLSATFTSDDVSFDDVVVDLLRFRLTICRHLRQTRYNSCAIKNIRYMYYYLHRLLACHVHQ